MNPRERLLAIGVGVIVGALVLWYATSSVLGRFEDKDRRIASLTKEVKKKKDDMRKAQLAAKRLKEYEARSLPPDADLAKSLYQAWLNSTIETIGLSDVEVNTLRVTPAKNTYQRLGFSVSAEGDLSQLVEFLYRFHEMDWLHRVDRLTVKPVRNSKKLALDLTISAASVNAAPRSEQLVAKVSESWQGKSLADYRDPILNRNFFGPPNSEPKLDVSASTSTYLGKTFELPVKATDPDPLDRVTYSLVKNVDPPARLDPQTGKLVWTPKAVGDYSFEVAVSDDGLPSKSKSQTIKVSVKEPPPPEKVVEAPKKPSFDLAKYTVLTAVLSVNNNAEVWLLVQPTGETRKLQTGDSFEIGSIKGEVSEIGIDDVIVAVDGHEHRLVKGANLLQAVTATD
jgi:hypothetical protein